MEAHDPAYRLEAYRALRINLRRYRRRMGLTQRELADRSGYTESYISRVEPLHSDKYPTLDYVFRMAQVLGVPPYLLFVRERDLDAYRAQEEPPAQAGSRGGPDRAQGRRSP